MKKKLLLTLATLVALAGCGDDPATTLQNHWKYGTVEMKVTRCELIAYGDAESDGINWYEFRLCSGTFNSLTKRGNGNFIYFKLGVTTGELADAVYTMTGDPQGFLSETGYTDPTTAMTTAFTTGNVDIKKSGDKYSLTFSLKDDAGVVLNGHYDGAFEFSDQKPAPGFVIDGSSIECQDEARLLAIDKVLAVLDEVQSDAEVLDSEWILAEGMCTNGSFRVTLPGSVNSSLLKDSHNEWPYGLTFSLGSAGVKQSSIVHFHGYSAGYKKGEFSPYDPQDKIDTYLFYMYFDGDITINGAVKPFDFYEIYDLTCVEGWNIVRCYFGVSDTYGPCSFWTTEVPRTAWTVYFDDI